MNLLAEFVKTAIEFVLMLGIITGAVFTGIALRKRKDAKKAE